MNDLFRRFGQPSTPNDPLQQFASFAQNFQGDPQQAVMNALQSGKMSQAQFNQLRQRAQQALPIVQRFFGK